MGETPFKDYPYLGEEEGLWEQFVERINSEEFQVTCHVFRLTNHILFLVHNLYLEII